MAFLNTFLITAIRYIITGVFCILCAFLGIKVRTAVDRKKKDTADSEN